MGESKATWGRWRGGESMSECGRLVCKPFYVLGDLVGVI